MHRISLVVVTITPDSWTQAVPGAQEINSNDKDYLNSTGREINVLVVGIGGTGAPQSIEGAIGVTRRY
jgi:hypothetical protein